MNKLWISLRGKGKIKDDVIEEYHFETFDVVSSFEGVDWNWNEYLRQIEIERIREIRKEKIKKINTNIENEI